MADVEMTDASVAPKPKSSKAGAGGELADGKKRFEVKKVAINMYHPLEIYSDGI